MDAVAQPSAYIETIAQYLRDNGFHVIPRYRVKAIVATWAIPLDDLAFFKNNCRLEDIARTNMSQLLAREITGSDCVLWSHDDDEFRRVHRADIRLIVPKGEA